MDSIPNIKKTYRKLVLDEMVTTAETLVKSLLVDLKDPIGVDYKLICLFVATGLNQVHTLLPLHSKELKSILTALIDIDLQTREVSTDKNGVLSFPKKSRKSIIGS